jgi:hypothetical protein
MSEGGDVSVAEIVSVGPKQLTFEGTEIEGLEFTLTKTADQPARRALRKGDVVSGIWEGVVVAVTFRDKLVDGSPVFVRKHLIEVQHVEIEG